MNKRIIITGAGGRLGAALVREWKAAGHDVVGLSRLEIDLSQPDQMRAVLGGMDFGVLVNCAAQTNVDRCETHLEEAMQVNAHAVRTIAEICKAKGARCLHISTDYVFDGAKNSPYTEEDPTVAISRYGMSKLAGETALFEVSERNLVVRVSWVFGPDRPSFVDQIIQRAQSEEQVAAVADKIAVPTYTLDAAQLMKPLLFDIAIGGVIHVCNSGECTWQSYGQHALDCAVAAGMTLKTKTVGALRMTDIKAFVAKRPPYTAMSPEKLARLTGNRPRHWKDAVRDYVENHVARRG